ncbi:MAG: hypothetical protein H0T96_00795 [Thermoleophilaceae bacterium]|nr:hypothetical protein [Thermoleophilaceae bacterium]
MIYCVVPESMAEELYPRLAEYYAEDPNVEVIIDRRSGPDRRDRTVRPPAPPEATRDRRRQRARGSFPATPVADVD